MTDIGPTITTLCACTLADYSSGGATAPAVVDVVSVSATGDWYVKRPGANHTKLLGRVVKVVQAPAGTAVGYVQVEWLDVVGFRQVAVSNLSNVTRGNSAKQINADSAAGEDFDAQATTGNLIVVAKSAASGGGTAVCA